MDVNIVFVEKFIVDAEHLAVRLEVLQGNNSRFLHHIAKIAGESELFAFALR